MDFIEELSNGALRLQRIIVVHDLALKMSGRTHYHFTFTTSSTQLCKKKFTIGIRFVETGIWNRFLE